MLYTHLDGLLTLSFSSAVCTALLMAWACASARSLAIFAFALLMRACEAVSGGGSLQDKRTSISVSCLDLVNIVWRHVYYRNVCCFLDT